MEKSLFEPRIPQNTGNIARTCAAYNITLNLIEPFGFKLEDKYLKRAGLDYWPLVKVDKYSNFENFYAIKSKNRIISFSKKNGIYLRDFKFLHYLAEKILDYLKILLKKVIHWYRYLCQIYNLLIMITKVLEV